MPDQVNTPTDARQRKTLAIKNALEKFNGYEIGELPQLTDAEQETKKELCRSLKKFATHCFPYHFHVEFNSKQLALIKSLEEVISDQDETQLRHCNLERGRGKSTFLAIAAIWAVLSGHRSFCLMVKRTAVEAVDLMRYLQLDIANSNELYRYFPEVCHPICMLEQSPPYLPISRGWADKQTYQQKKTKIKCSDREIILPTIDGSPSSGAKIHCLGIRGGFKGLSHLMPDGKLIRPDLLLIDGPLYDRSDYQSRARFHNIMRKKEQLESIAGTNKIATLEVWETESYERVTTNREE